MPDWTGSWINTFVPYKNFRLTVDMQYCLGE